jgi:hypothetical protein
VYFTPGLYRSECRAREASDNSLAWGLSASCVSEGLLLLLSRGRLGRVLCVFARLSFAVGSCSQSATTVDCQCI